MPVKIHKIIFFSRKKNKNMCVNLGYLKFSDPLPETHLFFFYFALLKNLMVTTVV